MGTIKDEDPQVSWGVVSDSVSTSDRRVCIASEELQPQTSVHSLLDSANSEARVWFAQSSCF